MEYEGMSLYVVIYRRSAINCELNIASKEFGKCVNKIFFYCEDFEPEVQKNEQVKRFS